jgi:hypothetical protein
VASPSTQRQQHYVSRTIQGSLLKQFATDWLVHFLLLWHGLFVLSLFGIPAVAANANAPAGLWERYVQFCQSHVHLALCGLLFFPLFFWNALRLSHRIAGPLERFHIALDALRRGEPVKPLTLRRDDLLVDYQRAFNRYLNHLEEEARSRGGLSKSTRAESDAAAEPENNPLIRELVRIQAEIHEATTDSRSSDR